MTTLPMTMMSEFNTGSLDILQSPISRAFKISLPVDQLDQQKITLPYLQVLPAENGSIESVPCREG